MKTIIMLVLLVVFLASTQAFDAYIESGYPTSIPAGGADVQLTFKLAFYDNPAVVTYQACSGTTQPWCNLFVPTGTHSFELGLLGGVNTTVPVGCDAMYLLILKDGVYLANRTLVLNGRQEFVQDYLPTQPFSNNKFTLWVHGGSTCAGANITTSQQSGRIPGFIFIAAETSKSLFQIILSWFGL